MLRRGAGMSANSLITFLMFVGFSFCTFSSIEESSDNVSRCDPKLFAVSYGRIGTSICLSDAACENSGSFSRPSRDHVFTGIERSQRPSLGSGAYGTADRRSRAALFGTSDEIDQNRSYFRQTQQWTHPLHSHCPERRREPPGRQCGRDLAN